MKVATLLAALLLITTTAHADEYVRGYTKKDGTAVNGYYRSSPDSSYNNNFGVRGNTTPYTGERGTASPTWNDRTPSYNTKTYGDPGLNTGYGSTGRSSGSYGSKGSGLYYPR